MASYDTIGSIAIMKFGKEKKSEKLKQAKELLKRKNIKTVVEKTDKVRGRLRTIKTGFLAGGNTKEALHKENDCRFRLNVDTCYFSPRLSEERKEIGAKIKKKDRVLVLFSGVGPFSVIAAKKAKEVVAIEISRECSKYAELNKRLNKVYNLEAIQGNVKRIIKKGGLIVKGNLVPLKFDVIVMPRPNLKDTFLEDAFSVSKKGTVIYYYGFCNKDKLEEMIQEIKEEAKKARKKIKILRVKKAGDIAPYKFRYRVEMKILE